MYLASAEAPHLLVADKHPVIAAPAWTQHRLPCGHPGDFIFLDRSFLNDTSDSRRGKKLAQEWAKYRWGVFEEHGYKGDPLYPFTREGTEAGKEENNLCLDGGNWLKSTSSLLSLADNHGEDEWKSIIQFCDSENHVFTESRHNNLCQGKSAWEIMRSHADFALNSSEPASGLIINVEHLRREYIVLLVEYTADMVNVDHKWEYLHDSVIQYLLHDLAWGTKVWVMAFASDVHLVAEVALTSAGARQAAAEALRQFANETEPGLCRDLQMAIGEAATVLYSNPLARDHGKIILITQPPDEVPSENFFCHEMNAVDLGSAQSGRQVMSILYITNASSNTTWYETMASNPPGKVLRVEDSHATLHTKIKLLDYLHQLDQASSDGELLQEIPPSKEPGCVKTFLLEDTLLPADGFLVIHREKDSNGTVSLHNSEGDQNLLLGQPELLDTADLFSVLFTIPGPWNLTLGNTDCTSVIPVVFVKRKSGFADVLDMGALVNLAEPQETVPDEPTLTQGTVGHPSALSRWPGLSGPVARSRLKEEAVLVDVRVSAPLQDVALGDSSDPVVMTARVTKDGKAVLGGVVVATVTECSGDGDCETRIPLFDNGSGAPDATGGDGVYSAYWHSANSSAAVPLAAAALVRAAAGENAAVLEVPVAECCPSTLLQRNVTSLGSFEASGVLRARVTRAGTLPPARVSDLTVTCSAFNFTSGRASVRFMSPFMIKATGQSYGIWYSTSAGVNTADHPNVQEFWTGSPGDPVEQDISVQCGSMLFFLVVGTSGRLQGKDSNLARAFCPCAPASGSPVVAIVLGVVGGIALVAVIALSVFYRDKISHLWHTHCKKKPNRAEPNRVEPSSAELNRIEPNCADEANQEPIYAEIPSSNRPLPDIPPTSPPIFEEVTCANA